MSQLSERYGFTAHVIQRNGSYLFKMTRVCAHPPTAEDMARLAEVLAHNLEVDRWRLERVVSTPEGRDAKRDNLWAITIGVYAHPPGFPLHVCGQPMLSNGITGQEDLCIRCHFKKGK